MDSDSSADSKWAVYCPVQKHFLAQYWETHFVMHQILGQAIFCKIMQLRRQLRITEWPRLQQSSKDNPIQPFLGKRAQMSPPALGYLKV